MPTTFVLFGTEHCHLCEEAEQLLVATALPYRLVDIAEDDALLETYGLRIPVLFREDNRTELNWPFTHPDITAFASD